MKKLDKRVLENYLPGLKIKEVTCHNKMYEGIEKAIKS